MASIQSEQLVQRPSMRQDWRCAAFLHWDYPPDVVGRLIPQPFEIHTHDARAWVGLTPFTTTLSLFGLLPLPGPRRFPETNVRTYVRSPDGTDGVWFFSLDVTNVANVPLGRLGMPYWWADLTVNPNGEGVRYAGRRRIGIGRQRPAYDVTVRYEPSRIEQQTPLDIFLTGRWHTYTKRGPYLGRFDIEHEPWPLRRAQFIGGYHEEMLEAAGLPPPATPPVAHYSPGVDVAISWPTSIASQP